MSHALSRRRSRALATGAVLVLTLGLSAGSLSPASALVLTPTPATYTNSTPIDIPDDGDDFANNAVDSVITVPAGGAISRIGDFAVTLLGLTHPYVEDLYVGLESPAGTQVVLLCEQDVAGTNSPDDADVTFSSDGLGEANCVETDPTYQTDPGDFTGEDPTGDWTLVAFDPYPDFAGSIARGFSIRFDQGAASTATAPQNVSVVAGTDATFSSTVRGTPAPDVQWQFSSDGGSTWSDIYGAHQATYSVTAPSLADDQKLYRAQVGNAFNDVTTSAATLTVTGSVPGAPTMTAGQTGPGEVTLQWTAPADRGSSAITGYRVHFPGRFPGEDYAYPSTVRSATFDNVSWGTHTFTITAENAAGRSPTSSVPLVVGGITPTPTPPAPARATPTLTTSTTVAVYGDRITFTGTGQPGETVRITRTITGDSAGGVTAVVDGTGRYTASILTTSSAVYQAKGATGLSGPTVFVSAKSKMRLAATRVAKRKYTLHGTVSPAKALQVVKVYYKKSSGAYGLLGSMKTSAKGAWTYTHTYSATKKFTFKAVAAATEKNASNYRTLSVSVH
ncbi:MAG: proprotein convertase P-domain-containing protein [Nocardioidaceae bacterium]